MKQIEATFSINDLSKFSAPHCNNCGKQAIERFNQEYVMIILTAASSDSAKNDFGETHKNFSFKSLINKTMRKAEECGYKTVVYDLDSLGMGIPFHIKDETFKQFGYYKKEVIKGYKSKSLFKPEMVQRCMEENNDLIVYLDGDAQLCSNIDEVIGDDYDIGVTLRDPYEFESEWYKDHYNIVKYVNAGVIFFNPTPATKKFLDIWNKETEKLGNDQMALNKLTCPDYCPEINSILEINGVRIKYFPGIQYNFYYFNRGLTPKIKIMHFKGSVRHFYPFDWKKNLYCMTIIPVINTLRPYAKKLLFR